VRHADHTGREVEMTLVAQARHEPNIHVFEQIAAIDLIIDNSACLGAFALHEQTGEVEPFLAKATVIASGGCGQIYQHTTNPQIATGDGVAIAWRAGCKIANMEFIQFHPTALYAPGARCFLISEGVRGEGAVLRRKDGTAFMAEYDERKDLAPRDIVARAIDSEMKKGGVECVYLDITHKDAEWLKAHFPTIYSHCLTFGIDITTDWIPVVPAAHYSCGGVLTDLDGHTSIDRLYAAGEAACTGVHGANRLASNSLLEALVFGKRAALDAKKRIATLTNPYPAVIPDFVWPWPNHAEPQVSASEIKARIEAVMQKYVGIVRSNSRLAKAALAIEALKTDATGLFDNGRINVEKLEAYNMLDVASLVVESAKRRKESRGLHYTTDYPAPVDSENKDTILVKK
jgi:L-aspartate oxidase